MKEGFETRIPLLSNRKLRISFPLEDIKCAFHEAFLVKEVEKEDSEKEPMEEKNQIVKKKKTG